MPTVINHYIESLSSIQKDIPKSVTPLIPDHDLNIPSKLKCQAGWITVDSDNSGSSAKKFGPHFQTATPINAYIQNPRRLSDETGKVPIINRKIWLPFVGDFLQ